MPVNRLPSPINSELIDKINDTNNKQKRKILISILKLRQDSNPDIKNKTTKWISEMNFLNSNDES